MVQTDTTPATADGNPRAGHILPRAIPIMAVQHETRDVFTLSLDVSGYEQGLPFRPGQFTMLYLFGAGEVPISISGDATQPFTLVHTVRAVGQLTNQLQTLECGAVLGVRGPFGTGWPVEEAHGRDILIIAGGVGLAPLRPVIYHLLGQRDNYGHISILYGARSPADILYSTELERWSERSDVEVTVIVDHADTGWHGDVGVVTSLLCNTRFDTGNTLAMICGPEIMMRFTSRELNELGIPDENIYLSMERNMQCAVGMCGHCQYGPTFVCKDGPVYRVDSIRPFFSIREL